MNKKIYLIVSLFFLVIVFTSYYFASAATVGVPNPGHTWAEMECSASTLCIDNVNSRLGIGTNDPYAQLHQLANLSGSILYHRIQNINTTNDSSGAGIFIQPTSGNWGSKIWTDRGGTGSAFSLKIGVSSSADPITTPRLTIKDDGNVGINTTSPGEKLEVNGNVSAAAYYYTSDIRLKDNISFLENSLSKILQLDGISYTLQSTKEDKLGFSAQELQKIYPELVKVGSDGYLSIDGTGLIAPLVEAIKEQQVMIESQQKQINELKNIINNLK